MKKRFLVTSILMLLLTVFALSTSTYAWFSMNTTVTATGLQVKAKSNATYLLIADSDTNGTATTTLTETVAAAYQDSATNENKEVYPAYYAAETGTMPGTAAAGSDLAVTAGKWYTANNTNSNNATNSTKNLVEISPANFDKYVLTYKVWLTLSKDSEDFNNKLTVKSTKTSGDDAASVVVEIGSEKIKLVNGADAVETTGTYAITATTNVEVTIYVYIDGTSTNVYSDFINTPNTLTGICSVEFGLVL